MADIFLSYNRSNKQIAQDVVDRLRRAGYTVWWDQEMTGGQAWTLEVQRQLALARATIVLWSWKCFSDDPDDRGHVQGEAQWVIDHPTIGDSNQRRILIPCVIPPFEVGDLRPPFNLSQTRRFNEYSKILEDLQRAKVSQSGEIEPELFESQNVFKTSGELPHTLIRRERIAEYRTMRSTILEKGTLVRLFGPTQSGKTRFALHSLEEMRPFQVHGKRVKMLSDVYDTIAINSAPELMEVANRQARIKRYLEQMQQPVLIDDFHWIPEKVQKAIIHDFKELREKDVSLLLISIPDCAERWLTGEYGTRSVAIEMPEWTDYQLREIPRLGFEKLRIVIHPSVIDEIIEQAHGNPALVQKLCLRLCHEVDIWESSKVVRHKVVSRDAIHRVFAKVADDIYGDRIVKLVNAGTKYSLNAADGSPGPKVTLDALTLKVLDLKGGFQPLKAATIRRAILEKKLVHKDERYKITEDRILLTGTQLIQQLREVGLAETTLGLEDNKFFLQHPNFKVHLHWKLLPDLKLGERKLIKYSEHTAADLVAPGAPSPAASAPDIT